jgi:hypothetical protein
MTLCGNLGYTLFPLFESAENMYLPFTMKHVMGFLFLLTAFSGNVSGQISQQDPVLFEDIPLRRSSVSSWFVPQLSWYSNSSAHASITYATGLAYTLSLSPRWQIQVPLFYSQQRGQDLLVRCPIRPCAGFEAEKQAYLKSASLVRYRLWGTRNGQLMVKAGPFLARLVQGHEVEKYAKITAGMASGLEFMYQVLPRMDMSLSILSDYSLTDMENPDARGEDGLPLYPAHKPKAISSNLGMGIGINWFFLQRVNRSDASP